jgi:hypothetical protein
LRQFGGQGYRKVSDDDDNNDDDDNDDDDDDDQTYNQIFAVAHIFYVDLFKP